MAEIFFIKLWDGPVVIMLSKINITLSISIRVTLNET